MKYPTDIHWQTGNRVLEHIRNIPDSGEVLSEQFESFGNRFRKEMFVEGDLGYELYHGGKWIPDRLISDIANHRFNLVLYTGQGGFVKPVKDALREHYVPIEHLPLGLYSGERNLYILVPGN
jgi:hypothetical protein